MKTNFQLITKVLFVTYLLNSSLLFSQWVITNAPVSCEYTSLAANSQYLFVASSDSGIYRTSDDGESWVKVNNGLSSLSIGYIMYHPIDGHFYCTSHEKVYKSTDFGDSWINISPSLSVSDIRHLHIKDSILFVSTYSGAYRSTDGGAHWEPINNGLTSPHVFVIKHKDNFLFA